MIAFFVLASTTVARQDLEYRMPIWLFDPQHTSLDLVMMVRFPMPVNFSPSAATSKTISPECDPNRERHGQGISQFCYHDGIDNGIDRFDALSVRTDLIRLSIGSGSSLLHLVEPDMPLPSRQGTENFF